MATDTPFAGAEEPDDWLRPAWEDTPDETDVDLAPRRVVPRPGAVAPLADADPLLLATLADASDALAQLDARLAAAEDTVRLGLLARLALTEAAGWLTHRHAWVHPLDLVLRDAGLTAPAALAAFGAGARALPHTMAQPTGRLAWDDPPLDTLPDTDQGIADALALARLLRRLPGAGPHPVGNPAAVADTLRAFGARPLDRDRLASWWDAHAPRPVPRRRVGVRHAGGAPMPALLAGARVAQAWMASGITDPPEPAQALLVGFGWLVRRSPARRVFVPLWSAYPAIGFGDRDALPTLRSDAADRLGAAGGRVTWPAAGLALIAESARAGLRELDRLEAAAANDRVALAGTDRRSRLPATLNALVRTPALTPKALAAGLQIAPQTATALLRDLQGRGVVKEVTGRGRFRAFAV
jgi:HTH DNA binding domain